MSTQSLFDVIAWVETKGNSKLQRFEPAVYAKILASRNDVQQSIIARIQAVNLCSWNTALVIYSTSYGATQIMGFNLYADQMLPYFNVADILNDPILQHSQFGDFVNWQKLNSAPVLLADPGARLAFAKKYNGDPAYADLIKAALIHYGNTVN
jgi:hypothetical protein